MQFLMFLTWVLDGGQLVSISPLSNVVLVLSSALCHEDVRGNGGIAPPSLTFVVDGGEWSDSRPCHFTPGGKSPPVHIGWAPESVWVLWRREKSCSAGNLTQAVQPVARCYTDGAILTAYQSTVNL
jgi:hypothetical protein